MNIDEILIIANAIKAGDKPVEKSPQGVGKWTPVNLAREQFDPAFFDYRIKPDPREVWLQARSDGTPTAGIILLEAPRPGSDGRWIHFVEVVP